jgi:hypothetical protein
MNALRRSVIGAALAWVISTSLVAPAAADVGPCPDHDEPLAEVLRDLNITVGGESRPIVGVRLVGLQHIDEGALWDLFGGRPTFPTSAAEAAAIVLRLRELELFDRVAATLQVQDDGTRLEIVLREHPTVAALEIQGAASGDEAELKAALFETPHDAPSGECPPVRPPLAWVAHRVDGALHPGILWRGLVAARDRGRESLADEGYEMATLDVAMREDGTLAVTVDPGRIESIEIKGAEASLVPEVRRALGLEPGRVFVSSEARRAVERVHRRFPFLVAGDHGGVDVDGRRLVVHLSERHGELRLIANATELLHYTPRMAYAPGLTVRSWTWDPQDRVHLRIDGQVNVSVKHGDLEWLAGPKVQIPRLQIAELGVQLHDFSDTGDAWRIDPLNAYLIALENSRYGRDYFRRRGWSAFLTAHLDERLTAGAEYRRDGYGPERGTVRSHQGALVLRGEWSSRRTSLDKVGRVWRHTETSIVDGDEGSRLVTGFRTLATVEIARPSLGGDGGFDYTRLVSESVLTLAAGRHRGLRLRAHFSGGDERPLRGPEVLGGWFGLRGYREREFRGDRLCLGTAEYRWGFVSAFVDVGSVRTAGDWIDPKVGIGGKLHFGDVAYVSTARRTDGGRSDTSILFAFSRAF